MFWKLVFVFIKLILPTFTYSDLELLQSISKKKKDIYTNLHMVHRVW